LDYYKIDNYHETPGVTSSTFSTAVEQQHPPKGSFGRLLQAKVFGDNQYMERYYEGMDKRNPAFNFRKYWMFFEN
jgi:hypothetical protein